MIQRNISLILLVLIFVSCSTSKDYYTVGTSASIFTIDPFPQPEQWLNILERIKVDIDKTADLSLMWLTGSYITDGIKFNFPGQDDDKNGIYFSNLDFNEYFFSYFDKNNIDVYLLLEPGSSDISTSINAVLDKYGNHKSVIGVAIDLEWLFNDENGKIDASSIEEWISDVKEYKSSYRLILKHWNRKKIEPFHDESILYLQNMQGIKSQEEVEIRHSSWSRYFYPSKTGIEFGNQDDSEVWKDDVHPVFTFFNKLNEKSEFKSSIFWDETSLDLYQK